MNKSNFQSHRSPSRCFLSLVLIIPLMLILPSDSIWQILARFVACWSLLLGGVLWDLKRSQPAGLGSIVKTGGGNSSPCVLSNGNPNPVMDAID